MIDPNSSAPVGVVLDTDIGSDVDDILALAVLLGSPEVDLRGVTTVYGDTVLRAKLVLHTLRLANRDVAVAAGLAETLSGKEVWWAGHEGRLLPDPDAIVVPDTDAVALLASAPTALAIGPLTDLASALARPDRAIEQAVIMGADFRRVDRIAEHNIACDITAAQRVFTSDVPVTVVGLDQTTRVRIRRAALDRIDAAGELGAYLAAEVTQWWGATSSDSNVPHDPIAVLTITDPDLFELTSGTVTIDDEGFSTLDPDPDGRHHVVSDLDEDGVATAIVARIEAAAAV